MSKYTEEQFEEMVNAHCQVAIEEGIEIHNLGWATTDTEICSKATNKLNQGVYFTSGFDDSKNGLYHKVRLMNSYERKERNEC